MRGWSRVLLPESANPPGANRASWPGYMVGTLWADKVLPGYSTRHRQERTGNAPQRPETHTDTHIHGKWTDKSPQTFT